MKLMKLMFDCDDARSYKSGFTHGVNDAYVQGNITCDVNSCTSAAYYITQPGQGFADHNRNFIDGYIGGFCLITSPTEFNINDTSGLDTKQASFSCGKGPDSASPLPGGN